MKKPKKPAVYRRPDSHAREKKMIVERKGRTKMTSDHILTDGKAERILQHALPNASRFKVVQIIRVDDRFVLEVRPWSSIETIVLDDDVSEFPSDTLLMKIMLTVG